MAEKPDDDLFDVSKLKYPLPDAPDTFAAWRDAFMALTAFDLFGGIDPRVFLQRDNHGEQWVVTWAVWSLMRDAIKEVARLRGMTLEQLLPEWGQDMTAHRDNWAYQHPDQKIP